MTELERYISSNAGAFDSEPVPAGSRERFMARVAAQKRKRRIRFAGMLSTGIAAAAAVMMTLIMPDISWELGRHHIRLAEQEKRIMSIVERDYPMEMENVTNIIWSITHEAIPLEDQLPDELSRRERSRILNDYYNTKHAALESLLAEL